MISVFAVLVLDIIHLKALATVNILKNISEHTKGPTRYQITSLTF